MPVGVDLPEIQQFQGVNPTVAVPMLWQAAWRCLIQKLLEKSSQKVHMSTCLGFHCLDFFFDPCLGTEVSGWKPHSEGLKLKTCCNHLLLTAQWRSQVSCNHWRLNSFWFQFGAVSFCHANVKRCMWVCVSVSLSLSLSPCLQEPSSTSTCVIARKMVTRLQTSRACSFTMWGARGILGSLNSSQCSGLEPQVWNNFVFSESLRHSESNSCGPPSQSQTKTQRLGTTKIETFQSFRTSKYGRRRVQWQMKVWPLVVPSRLCRRMEHAWRRIGPLPWNMWIRNPRRNASRMRQSTRSGSVGKSWPFNHPLVGFCVGVRGTRGTKFDE